MTRRGRQLDLPLPHSMILQLQPIFPSLGQPYHPALGGSERITQIPSRKEVLYPPYRRYFILKVLMVVAKDLQHQAPATKEATGVRGGSRSLKFYGWVSCWSLFCSFPYESSLHKRFYWVSHMSSVRNGFCNSIPIFCWGTLWVMLKYLLLFTCHTYWMLRTANTSP